MRFVAIAVLLLSYPMFLHLLRSDPRWRYWACFALGVLPFTVALWNLDAAIINWAAWPGYAKGFVITLEDSIALAIITTQRHPRGVPPLMGWVGLYMAAVVLSIFMAGVPMAAFFYLIQMMRFAVVMMAVAKIAVDPRALQWLGMGLASVMAFEAVVTINQKLQGVFQAPGTMAHPNQLGMMTHLAVMPILGMLLSGFRSRLLMLGVASALVVVVLGASRATIGFLGLGIGLLLLLSLRRRSTPYKKRIFAMAAAAMVVATPFLLQSLSERLEQQYEQQSEYDEREAFERAAKAMWKDHPMGVGANNYVVVANGQGYSMRAGVAWNGGSRAANVHNTYLLVAAETGWVGLITYGLMIGATILAGWRFAFSNRSDPRGEIALGCTVALMAMAWHSRYEWITLTYYVQYMIAISVGMVSGLIRVRALERTQAVRARAAAASSIQISAGEAIA